MIITTFHILFLQCIFIKVSNFGAYFPSVCGGEYNTAGEIKSPNYPNHYPPHLTCTYKITLAQAPGVGKRAPILFAEDFDLEDGTSCEFDGLVVGETHMYSLSYFAVCGGMVGIAHFSLIQFLKRQISVHSHRADYNTGPDGNLSLKVTVSKSGVGWPKLGIGTEFHVSGTTLSLSKILMYNT